MWRLAGRLPHCPGDCYVFVNNDPAAERRAFHIPVQMFWSKLPWLWANSVFDWRGGAR